MWVWAGLSSCFILSATFIAFSLSPVRPSFPEALMQFVHFKRNHTEQLNEKKRNFSVGWKKNIFREKKSLKKVWIFKRWKWIAQVQNANISFSFDWQRVCMSPNFHSNFEAINSQNRWTPWIQSTSWQENSNLKMPFLELLEAYDSLQTHFTRRFNFGLLCVLM